VLPINKNTCEHFGSCLNINDIKINWISAQDAQTVECVYEQGCTLEDRKDCNICKKNKWVNKVNVHHSQICSTLDNPTLGKNEWWSEDSSCPAGFFCSAFGWFCKEKP